MPAPHRSTAQALREAPQAAAGAAITTDVSRIAPAATLDNLRSAMMFRREAIAAALPRGSTDAQRFMQLVLIEAGRNPRLLEATPTSILGAAVACAQLGLEPGPLGEVYLTTRRNKQGRQECVAQIGYRGLEALAHRHEGVVSISSNVVREGDDFTFLYGSEPYLRHRPALTAAEEGPLVAAWCLAKLRNGGEVFVVLSRREVMARRARSDAVRSGKTSPWDTDEAAMWRKSAVRSLLMSGSVPLSTEARRALSAPDEIATERIEANVIDALADEGEPEVGAAAPPPSKEAPAPEVERAPTPAASEPVNGGGDASANQTLAHVETPPATEAPAADPSTPVPAGGASTLPMGEEKVPEAVDPFAVTSAAAAEPASSGPGTVTDTYGQMGLVELMVEAEVVLHDLWKSPVRVGDTRPGRTIFETLMQDIGWQRDRGPAMAFVRALPRATVETLVRSAARELAELSRLQQDQPTQE